ncbi:hypothetical protein, partial [Kitasatospora indigofera]|uniref:hypothetical protein n=1 Tax=Kitasatospora indigofera TaxID=67307 RepID=UPI0036A56AD5
MATFFSGCGATGMLAALVADMREAGQRSPQPMRCVAMGQRNEKQRYGAPTAQSSGPTLNSCPEPPADSLAGPPQTQLSPRLSTQMSTISLPSGASETGTIL